MKKTLKTILLERTDTIEYRAIRRQLMTVAQNGGNQLLLKSNVTPKTITQLQNEMLTIELIEDHGWKKYKITW